MPPEEQPRLGSCFIFGVPGGVLSLSVPCYILDLNPQSLNAFSDEPLVQSPPL